MTVPIHVPGFDHDLNLCYEIHGAKDKYFNLVSDGCTSVNAHYANVPEFDTLNIIDSMSIVAVDSLGECHNITIDAGSCNPIIDGNGGPEKRKRHAPSMHYDAYSISVYSHAPWVRISVPNCADNALTMWVICQNEQLYDPNTDKMIGPVDMIKFEITRGLNLKETSHGLLGKFSH